MKKYIYIIFVAAMSMVASCDIPFDLGYDENPVIFLEAFPGATADHIDITVLPAYSKSNSALKPQFNPEIVLSVNGKTVPVQCRDDYNGLYRADYCPQPGDHMTISVVSEGFHSVYAETTIPGLYPERKIDYRRVADGLDSYDCVLYVTISDINPEYVYGLQIYNEYICEYPTGPESMIYKYSGDLYPDKDDLHEMVPISMEAFDIELHGNYLWAWEGDSINNSEATFAIEPRTYGYIDLELYDSFFVQEGKRMTYDDNGNELGVVEYVDRNKLLLYTMTQEFYKYKVSYEFQADYDGFISLVAPTNYCYSNIENGYGAFAGISIVETEWITKEFIENNR